MLKTPIGHITGRDLNTFVVPRSALAPAADVDDFVRTTGAWLAAGR
jgi:hypothetical protein